VVAVDGEPSTLSVVCMCICVSSSYRFVVNSSCTHTYTKQNWFFFLYVFLSHSRLSFFFFFYSFLYSSSTSAIYRWWEYFFPIVPPRLSSSIFELSHSKFSRWLVFHSDVTRSFAWLRTMLFAFFLTSFVFFSFLFFCFEYSERRKQTNE
jgi:hypothetical protein